HTELTTEIAQLGQTLARHLDEDGGIVHVRSVVGNPACELAELWKYQDVDTLPNESLVRQPAAPMSEQIRARRGPVEAALAHGRRKIPQAQLPVGKRFAESIARCQLVRGQRQDDQTWTRALLQEAAETEIPVKVMSLLDGESLYFVLAGKVVVEVRHHHAL